MQHRADDPPALSVLRGVPTTWLLGVLTAICAQAILVWATQREQAITIVSMQKEVSGQISAMTEQQRVLSAQLSGVSGDLQQRLMKDFERDMRLQLLESRVLTLEGGRKPPPPPGRP